MHDTYTLYDFMNFTISFSLFASRPSSISYTVSAKSFTPSSHIDNLHSHPRIFTIAHRNLDDRSSPQHTDHNRTTRIDVVTIC